MKYLEEHLSKAPMIYLPTTKDAGLGEKYAVFEIQSDNISATANSILFISARIHTVRNLWVLKS
jgi:hypothetical protein